MLLIAPVFHSSQNRQGPVISAGQNHPSIRRMESIDDFVWPDAAKTWTIRHVAEVRRLTSRHAKASVAGFTGREVPVSSSRL
jgi:hypothetical protein